MRTIVLEVRSPYDVLNELERSGDLLCVAIFITMKPNLAERASHEGRSERAA